MSDSPAAKAAGPNFTEKEELILKVAWLCLKSGPPDVDIDKLQILGGFATRKTTSNTWGAIKKKLLTVVPDAEGEDAPVTPATTKPKGKATPKTPKASTAKKASTTKSAAKAKAEPASDNDNEGDEIAASSPAPVVKTPKGKKGKVAASADAPTLRTSGRKRKAPKVADENEEAEGEGEEEVEAEEAPAKKKQKAAGAKATADSSAEVKKEAEDDHDEEMEDGEIGEEIAVANGGDGGDETEQDEA